MVEVKVGGRTVGVSVDMMIRRTVERIVRNALQDAVRSGERFLWANEAWAIANKAVTAWIREEGPRWSNGRLLHLRGSDVDLLDTMADEIRLHTKNGVNGQWEPHYAPDAA